MRTGTVGRRSARPAFQGLEPRMLLNGEAAAVGQGTEVSTTAAIQLFGNLPAVFVENQGQWADPSLRYAFDGPSCGIAFRDTGLDFHLLRVPANAPAESVAFTMIFDGADATVPAGEEQTQAQFNYQLGDQANWRSNVPSYQVLTYSNLYAGIDLRTFGQRTGLKYEFHVAPGADYTQIQVSYDGIQGLSFDAAGQLHVALGDDWEELIEDAPVIYQQIAGQRVEVAGRFELVDADTYRFAITGDFDPASELIIDPNLAWSTYLGGLAADMGFGVAVDGSGNILITGQTASAGWTSGGLDTSHNGDYDAFVVKLSPTGGHLWSTYLGGTDWDEGLGIAVDDAGNVLVTGKTASPGWTSAGGDTSYNGNGDAFVAKLSPTGGHIWSTYLGGNHDEYGYGIAVDDWGNALVTGYTESPGWTSGGCDTAFNGYVDAFVVKLSPAGGCLWSTFLGGDEYDEGDGIAVDGSGNVLITGFTQSAGWTSGGFDTSLNGYQNAFVVKLSPTGGHLWSTYLGGAEYDDGRGIAVDGSGNVLITGFTQSPDWTCNGFDTTFNGYYDAFVAKLSPSGGHLWSTYLGGAEYDEGDGIVVDGVGNVLVTGSTQSPGWISGGIDASYNGGGDAFLAKLSPAGAHLWSTYLGGAGDDAGCGLAKDDWGNVLVTGYTASPGWTSGGSDTSYNGGAYDVFLAKIDDAMPGDANRDGAVDVGDLGILGANYGKATGMTWAQADFTGDGAVDVGDLAVLGVNYGQPLSTKRPGDANGDGVVDVGDLGVLGFNYGKTSGMTWAKGDFTGDGAVDVGDLGVLGAHYGAGAAAGLGTGDSASPAASLADDASPDAIATARITTDTLPMAGRPVVLLPDDVNCRLPVNLEVDSIFDRLWPLA